MLRKKLRHLPIAVLWIGGIFLASEVPAYVLPLTESVGREALSESVPTAFAAFDLSPSDYRLEWGASGAIPGVGAKLEANSIEWVRVNEVLVIPRARMVLSIQDVSAAGVVHSGFAQSLAVDAKGLGSVTFPVALLSGDRSPIEITLIRRGQTLKGQLFLRFSPRPELRKQDRVLFDPSCSRYGVFNSSKSDEDQNDWVYVGCRMVQVEGLTHRTSNLELYVFWDNVGQQIEVGGVPTRSESSYVWPLRQASKPGVVKLKGGKRELALRYSIPEEFHRGFVGLGIGPYSFFFRDQSEEVSAWTLLPTFYASYMVTETMRVVAFDATTLNEQFITDFGVYVNSEYIRTLDRRFAMNIMLGGHFIGYRHGGKYYFKVGIPQGVEMIYFDFLKRAYNLTLGGFVYPEIQGKYYYNTWIRWGSPALFGEMNFISWAEKIDEKEYSSRSVGFSIGFPIPFLRFL